MFDLTIIKIKNQHVLKEINQMGKFLTPLKVELISHDPAKWKLLEPLIYDSRTVGKIIVPEGFVTDFASVPRVPIAYLLTGGLGHAAATLHDFLYSNPHETGTGKRVTREEADRVLLGAAIEGMKLCGNGFITAVRNQLRYTRARIMWIGVRMGGTWHWDK